MNKPYSPDCVDPPFSQAFHFSYLLFRQSYFCLQSCDFLRDRRHLQSCLSWLQGLRTPWKLPRIWNTRQALKLLKRLPNNFRAVRWPSSVFCPNCPPWSGCDVEALRSWSRESWRDQAREKLKKFKIGLEMSKTIFFSRLSILQW